MASDSTHRIRIVVVDFSWVESRALLRLGKEAFLTRSWFTGSLRSRGYDSRAKLGLTQAKEAGSPPAGRRNNPLICEFIERGVSKGFQHETE